MERSWTLVLRKGRPISAVETDPSGRVLNRSDTVWTLKDLYRRAGKSRRQVYRDLASGRIRPLGKFLGEWLVDASSLARLKPMPPSCAALFPEYDPAQIEPLRDRELVLSRILRFGGPERLRWAFSFYGGNGVLGFVRDRGGALLDPICLGFWRLYFELKAEPIDLIRLKGRAWGGAS